MKQLPFLKFKEREETKGIMVFCTEDDMPVEKYARIMMRKGWFSVGYNYLIHPDGTIEEGLSPNECCDPTLSGWEDHMCVLVMGRDDDKPNRQQDEALFRLSKMYDLPLYHDGFFHLIKG